MFAGSLSILTLLAAGASAAPTSDRIDNLSAPAKRAVDLTKKFGSATWSYEGCWMPSPMTAAGHSLDTAVIPLLNPPIGSQNGQYCLDYALSKGYTTVLISDQGSRCAFGNRGVLPVDQTSSALSSATAYCSALMCYDNRNMNCGSSYGGDLYLFVPPPAPTSSTLTPDVPSTTLPADGPTSSPSTSSSSTSTSSSASTASSSSSTSEPAAPAAPTPTFLSSYKTSGKKGKTFKRKGCYSDLMYGTRALPNLLAQPVNHTVEGCLEACATGKFSLCGVEYHGECWGANKLDSTSQPLDDSACELTCSDDSTEYCGGTGGPAGASFQLFSSA